MERAYLFSVKKQFEYYKLLGEKTFEQLDDDGLFWQYNPASNSIAIIVNHLWGNMLSRWTDFLTTDGEKSWRERDQEFQDGINESNFNTRIYIRNQEHTIPDAMNRQLAHYAYHVGQIVFIGRMIKNENWKSLSIPKGASKSFNQEKFSKGKHGGHFSDDLK